MRKYLVLILFILSVSVTAYAEMNCYIAGVVVSSGDCTTPSIHTYDQGFETAFPITSWTVSSPAPTSGATLSGSPPTDSCSKGVTGADDTDTRYAYYNYGSTLSTFYFRLDFMYTANTVPSWDHQLFFAAGQSTTYDVSSIGYLRIYDQGGAFEMSFNGSSSVTVEANPAVNTWYKITGYIDSGTPANSWIKINGGSATTIAPHAVAPQYFFIGDVNSKEALAWEIGYFAIDDEEIS